MLIYLLLDYSGMAFTRITCIGVIGSLHITLMRETKGLSRSSISAVLSLMRSVTTSPFAMLISPSTVTSTAGESLSTRRMISGISPLLLSVVLSSNTWLLSNISPNLTIFLKQ